jgi:hypothetical protein
MAIDITNIIFSSGELRIQAPTENNHVSNKEYVDTSVGVLTKEFNNAGEVKVNGAAGVKPVIQWGGGGVNPNPNDPVQLVYGAGALDISGSEITKWPANITTPQDSDFYDSANNTFLENTLIGQRHEWRFDFSYAGKGAGATTGIRFRLYNTNPASSLNLIYEFTIPNERTSGGILVLFRTIADSVSLPPPIGNGQGYNIELTADDPITITLDSVLRSSVIPNRFSP